MALRLANRVKESSLTSGSGTITLNGAVAGYQSFSAALSNGDTTYYTITNSDQWEVGIGTYTGGTLSRDTVLSSSASNAKLSLSGQSYVFIAYPSEKSVHKDSNDQVVAGSSGILLNTGSPSNTTDVLYNISGSLYFDGSPLGNVYTAGNGLVLTGNEFSIDNSVVQSGDNISLLVNDSGYINTELNDLSSNVTWINIPDAYITQSSVVQYSGALQITESQIVDLQNYLTAHPTISAASSSDNSGRTYVQDILLDNNGHVTGISVATETVLDTNTTYTAGTGLSLNGTVFDVNVNPTIQSVAPESITSTSNRTYSVQVDSNDKLVVNVPWTTGISGGGGGDITAVIAGTGLSGGGTSGDVTLNIDSTVIQSGDNISLLVNDSGYINQELNDLTANVTWTNIPDAYITESSVIQHSGAIRITESQIVDLQNYLTSHPSISAASSSDNSGRTYIQDILLDNNGHVTGISVATETVVDTDTTYTAGTGLVLTGTEFNIDSTVIQSGDNISLLINDAGYLTSINIPESGDWNTAYDVLVAQSGNWNTAYNWVNTNSSNVVLTTNSYANPSWLTSINANIISGIISSSNLPSYVDDVLEYAGTGNFPVTGSGGIIYVDTDNNDTYRWGGSQYIELTDDTAVWGNIGGTLSDQTDVYNAIEAKAASGDNVSIFTNDAGYVDGAGSGNHIAFWTDSNTLSYDSNKLYWDSSNDYLGIGTSSPSAHLAVVGNVLNTYAWIGDGTNSQSASLSVKSNKGSIGLYQLGGSSNGYTQLEVTIDTDTTQSFNIGTQSDNDIMFFVDATELVRFDSSTQRVGIGTSTPSTLLDVDGVITATGGNSTQWNTAYGWGDHASAGYITAVIAGTGISGGGTSGDVTINIDNTVIQSGDNISLLNNDAGYLTSLSGITVIANTGYFDVISFNVDDESILTKGQISWDDTEGTMDIGLTDNTTIHIGSHRYFRIRNETGGTLYKGQVVYATGIHANGIIEPALYVADGTIREVRFMGVVLEDVNNQNNGYVIDFGHLENMDLDGSATNYAVGDETWNAGDILYVHPTAAGKLTKNEPKHSISVAIILDVGNGNGNGRMFVRPTSYGHLDDNHDVAVSGATNGQFLQYNSATDYWVPSSSGNFTTLLVNGTPVPTGVGTSNYVTKWTGANSLGSGIIYDNGTNVGIGTASPQAKLDVNGTVQFDDLVRWEYPDKLLDTNIATLGYMRLYDEAGAYCGLGVSTGSFNIGTSGAINVRTITNGVERSVIDTNGNFIFNDAGNNCDFRVEGDTDQNLLFVDASADKIGIGASQPSQKLDVNGRVKANLFITQDPKSATNLPVGWYTIAVNIGNRAIGRFGLTCESGGRHQGIIFYASHYYGAGNQISILHNNRYSGSNPISRIRIKEGGTYDGCLLQVYIDDANNTPTVYLLNDNISTAGWNLVALTADGTNPGGVSNFANLNNVAVEVDLDITDFGTTGQSIFQGNVGIGTSSPSNKLTVIGAASFGTLERTPNNADAAGFYDRIEAGGGTQTTKSYGSIWLYNASNTQTHSFHSYPGTNNYINNGGNFGVGTSTPSAKLNVENGNIIFNDLGGNYDFRVEGDTDANLLSVDASLDRVGIGILVPQAKLDVRGSLYANDVVTLGSGSIPLGRKPIELLNPTNIAELTINDSYTFPTSDGSADQVLVTDGSGNASWTTVNTSGVADNAITYDKLSDIATESDNVQKRVAKAWVNFTGTGTVAITDDFNVSSITDVTTGQYFVNFTTAMPNTDYAVATASCVTTAGVAGTVHAGWAGATVGGVSAKSTSQVFIGTIDSYGAVAYRDANEVNAIIFGN